MRFLAGEKTLPPSLPLPFLWCWATSGLMKWTPAAIALPCYRIQSKPQYGTDGDFFFSRKFNEVGLWWQLSFYYHFNIQNQTQILWMYWQINALVFLGQWRIFSSSSKRKEERNLDYIFPISFGLYLQNQCFLSFCKSDRKRDDYISMLVVYLHTWCSNQEQRKLHGNTRVGSSAVFLKGRQTKNDYFTHPNRYFKETQSM